jgi:membrane protein DedA with SNARE-associated domain
VPGGRIPVLLAAAIGGYPFRRYVMADLAAALLWSIVYAAIGLFGRTVFPEPWQGAVAAVVLIIVISLIPPIWRRISNSPAEADAATPH